MVSFLYAALNETNCNIRDSKNFQKECGELIKQSIILDFPHLSLREKCTIN